MMNIVLMCCLLPDSIEIIVHLLQYLLATVHHFSGNAFQCFIECFFCQFHSVFLKLVCLPGQKYFIDPPVFFVGNSFNKIEFFEVIDQSCYTWLVSESGVTQLLLA